MAEQEQENFRDSIGTITKEGKRNFIFPKKPSGKYTNYRTYVSWFLLAVLVISPFIKINGNQFLLFNIMEGKYNIFGQPFWPQDFYLLVLSMLVGIVFIILFTVIFGRIFCGWVCPQTIFMEMVFRKVEYWIEGDRGKQIRLNKQPWNAEKIRKKAIKWAIFFLISFLIANVFLAYFIGSDVLLGYITGNPLDHIGTLVKLLVFTLVFFFVFAWFREQVCIIVCPYGRLQGVLLDRKSIVVAYDHKRGENENGRKKFRKDEDREELGHGDCIDCNQCVVVCPTGIDIRNGTQLECVNCTACIDACDEIMDKVGFEPGLIRYASEDNITKGEKFKFNARIKAYSAVLTILVGVLVTLLFLRSDIEATILRLPGQTFTTTETSVSNVYTFKLINKTVKDLDNVEIKLISHAGDIRIVGGTSHVPKGDLTEGTLFIDIDKKDLESSKEKLKIGIYSNGELVEKTSTNFTGPMKIN
ncbi:cytochrome c oxidase accessory protein CcoG [Aureibaculum sp. 2210JD6-5]|uniref:cytochrome c oxidase accessory protein CcoG n=1 Tax=Aureibaculum sp. 2210JD6-5 TaxID=3103957 RepID=UPI002AAD5834|nr:cytochrome c oxidase accessory protein CcoG [Aureibaculum sp. 2210JD6-5]MDY7396667.1 cytochrome c oxidase accessory protein CcoG [Aureibaculum sp. 2210JD6-5]